MSDANGSTVPARPRRRWVSMLLAVVLLVCGGLIGSGLTVLTVVKRAQYVIHHPEVFPERMASRLRRTLGLSPDQQTQVEEILRRRQLVLQGIRREVQPRVEVELDRARDEIAGVLSKDQASRWAEIFERQRKNWLPSAPGPATAPAKQGNP